MKRIDRVFGLLGLHKWVRFNHRAADSASRECSRCGRFQVADMQNHKWAKVK